MTARIDASVDDGVLRLVIANPDRANALTRDMLRSLTDHLHRAANDDAVRTVVLRGAGGTFSSGYALASFPDPDDLQEADELTEAGDAIATCSKATVAVLEGAVIGAGLELAVAADFRIASAGAKLGITPAKFGIVYPWQGIARLVDRLGEPVARRLLLTAEILDAETARSLGIVDEVTGADGTGADGIDGAEDRWIGRLRRAAPLSVAGTKQVLDALVRSGDALAVDPKRRAEILALRRAALASADAAEARAAFVDKRVPTFIGR